MTLLLNETAAPYTAEEIQLFIGAVPDGQWGPKTAEAARIKLGYPKYSTGDPWKRHRLIVGVIQMMLNEEGANLTVDGILGEETINAVRAKAAGLLKPASVENLPPTETVKQTLWGKLMTYLGRA